MSSSHYELVREERIDELRSTCRLLRHKSSGALLFHLHNDDPENVFCLSLSTYPTNSSGVAHILEHMVLCGSKKYPVKDPFFSMIRRSLNTFMNAFTGSDFTCYPAASQNRIDFYNLLDVYIDAVFCASLDDRSFQQEGHRLELKDPEQLKQLVRAGIVYNEMKGAYVSPETHLWNHIHEQLLCDTCYHFDSGGDPVHIPKLTHEDLRAFHKSYYHPSRCIFFFYGNIETQEHADFLHSQLLNSVEPLPPLPKRALQPRWESPRTYIGVYPASQGQEGAEDDAGEGHDTIEDEGDAPDTGADEQENAITAEVSSEGSASNEGSKPMAAFSWLTHAIQATRENLLIDLLDYLLMGHDGAPLKRFLLESGLCRQAGSAIDHEMTQIPYTLLLRDCQDANIEELGAKLFKKLREIYEEGFGRESITSALHQLKLSRLEISGGGYPFGLTLFFRSALAMQQGADPIDALKLHTHFESLKHLSEDPSELMNQMKLMLLDNPHRLDLWLNPDAQWAQKAAHKEEQELQAIESSLLPEQKKALVQASESLKRDQEREESRDLLPVIPIASIHAHSQNFSLEQRSPQLFTHSCFTNGFIYCDTHLQLSREGAEQLTPLMWHELKLLAYLWPRLGAAGRSYEQQLELLDLHSGGLECSMQLISPSMEENAQEKAYFNLVFSIHGLTEKAAHFMPLLESSIFELRLDETARIYQLIETLQSALVNQLPSQALQYAISSSTASFSSFSAISDWVSGLDFARFIQSESQKIKRGESQLLPRLMALKQHLIQSSMAFSAVTADESDLPLLPPLLQQLHGKLTLPLNSSSGELSSLAAFTLAPLPSQKAAAYELNSQVSFNALSLKGPSLDDPQAMHLRLACELLKHRVLHPEIREKGGAYGYGCNWSADKQTLTFHSYRDPHIQRTYDIFELAASTLSKGLFSEEDLDEAKRCWIQKLDKPVPPGERASLAYCWELSGLDLELRNQMRRQLLDTTKEQIIQAAQVWLIGGWSERRPCTFGPADQIRRETPWTPTRPLN